MRIPTEAEYEYAARANSPAPRWGELDEIAWYKANSEGRTHEVGKKKPNAFNLYDILGNVWEYTADPYKPEHPISVAMRGGGWLTKAPGIRVSYRGFDLGDVKRKFTGFRCVAD
jgi:formylglycine-generating enzyme required for sulfatase activity